MTLVYMLYVALVFFWQISLAIKSENSKRKAVGLYVFFSVSPVVLSGVLFMGLLGYEMVTKTVVMSESFARELIFTTAIGAVTVLISTLIFSLAIALINYY